MTREKKLSNNEILEKYGFTKWAIENTPTVTSDVNLSASTSPPQFLPAWEDLPVISVAKKQASAIMAGKYYCSGCGGYHDKVDDDDPDFDDDEPMSDEFAEFLQEAPWEQRGLHVDVSDITPLVIGKNNIQEWKKACEDWGVDYHLDPVQSMADFYLLDGIAGMVFNGFKEVRDDPACREIAREAAEMQDDLIATLDRSFKGYVDMAVGGEVRHHPAVGPRGFLLHLSRETAWRQWKLVRSKVGPQALKDAALLFRDYQDAGGSEGVGGENWAIAAELLYARITGKLTPRDWVDRCFTLEHNGGCLFNKIQWDRRTRVKWDVSYMRVQIGPAHDANPPFFGILLVACSDRVTQLFNRWWAASNQAGRVIGRPMAIRPTWRSEAELRGSSDRTSPTRRYTWKRFPSMYAQGDVRLPTLESLEDTPMPKFTAREWAWLRAWRDYAEHIHAPEASASTSDMVQMITFYIKRLSWGSDYGTIQASMAASYIKHWWEFTAAHKDFKPPRVAALEREVRSEMYTYTLSHVFAKDYKDQLAALAKKESKTWT